MTKKGTNLLICYCRSKKKEPKTGVVLGESCFCVDYNAKLGKGTTYKDVLIN